ncbi:hypothetical protein EV426DRAFT_686746 [Tirmania nivea]|nr:hypothetical protein EV426DRAFT_686746 [Tirmania nivea]
MPPKTSKRIKELQLELKLHDSQLTRAIDYAGKHPKESKAKLAKAFGVNPTTLRRGCQGVQALRSKARQSQQLLTAGEEEAGVDWCGRMSDLYFPGSQTLDRAYIEGEKVRIATAKAFEADKATNGEARRLAKEVEAKEAKEVPEYSSIKSHKCSKFDAEGADLRRLENAMSFMTHCERAYGEPTAASRGHDRLCGRGSQGERGKGGVIEGIENLVTIEDSG